jgi:hypothetical protein
MQLRQLTLDQVAHLAPGQGDIQLALQGLSASGDESELITSGALSLTIPVSRLSVTGTQAFTLADGTFKGQTKRVECVVAATTPLGTLTIASPETTAGMVCSATFVFDVVGQAVELIWTGTKWRASRVQRGGSSGANGVVVGTTVLTGKNMWAHYSLSVTGTVSSTTTKAIPDGSSVGEIIQVGCATAASTPSGTIGLTGLSTLGAAATTLGAFNATTCYAALMWNGTGWQLIGNTTVVLS